MGCVVILAVREGDEAYVGFLLVLGWLAGKGGDGFCSWDGNSVDGESGGGE